MSSDYFSYRQNFRRLLSLFLLLFVFTSLTYSYADSDEEAAEGAENIVVAFGETSETSLTLNDNEIASRKITVKDGKKEKYKVKVETTLSDSYWKGSELELTSGDDSLFNGTFASLSGSQTFIISEDNFTTSVTPSLEKGAGAEYSVTYTITQGKNSAVVILKYKPLRIKSFAYKGILGCSALLILLLIVKKVKHYRTNHFALKLSLLILLFMVGILLVFGFEISYMKDDSMSPDIKENALIISKTVDADSIKKGDIIIIRSSDNMQEVVEKVKKIDTTSMKVVTKNEDDDSLETESSTRKIQGKVLFSIPRLGKVLSIIRITIT